MNQKTLKSLKSLIILSLSLITNLCWGAPLTEESIQQAFQLSDRHASFDQIMGEQPIVGFHYDPTQGSFLPTQELKKENEHWDRTLGEVTFLDPDLKSETREVVMISKETIESSHTQVLVMTLFDLTVTPRLEKVSITGRVKVFPGHDETILKNMETNLQSTFEGKSIAEITFTAKTGNQIHINLLRTNPNWRKKGIAEQLNRNLISLFSQHLLPRRYLTVTTISEGSAYIYKYKLAFKYKWDSVGAARILNNLGGDANYILEL